MAQYKNILSAWINARKDGSGVYLSLKNESDKPVTIEPGKNIIMNLPRVPLFSISEKVEEAEERVDINGDIPF